MAIQEQLDVEPTTNGESLSDKAAEGVKRPGYWRDASQIMLGNAGREFDTAMLEVQKAIAPVIEADKENAHFKSKYASLANVIAILRPLLNEHGFLLRQSAGDVRTYGGQAKGSQFLTIATHITHVESGQWEMVLIPVPISDRITSLGAASTYGKRISLLSYHGIATEDSDGMVAIQNIIDQEAVNAAADVMIEALQKTKTDEELTAWLSKNDEGFKLYTESTLAKVRTAFGEHRKGLREAEKGKKE
jgi:hypothetical protein